jgi:hypothetical protein
MRCGVVCRREERRRRLHRHGRDPPQDGRGRGLPDPEPGALRGEQGRDRGGTTHLGGEIVCVCVCVWLVWLVPSGQAHSAGVSLLVSLKTTCKI